MVKRDTVSLPNIKGACSKQTALKPESPRTMEACQELGIDP